MHRNNFFKDDFLDIKSKYFEPQKNYFNPAHAININIVNPDLILNRIHQVENVTEYNNDYTESGQRAKKSISTMLKMTDNIQANSREITITPSITSSSLIVLRALVEKGIKKIWLDTPCYYATLYQMEALGLEYELIPTYLSENFQWQKKNLMSNEAIWITQPRISISKNQDPHLLNELIEGAKKEQYVLVIDEATELMTPSIVSKVLKCQCDNIIRLRGIYKPLSINGPRISYILHSQNTGKTISKWIWTFHGGIDSFSINSLPQDKSELILYLKLLEVTLDKAKKAHRLLNTYLLGTKFNLMEYQNGYTTSVSINLSKNGDSFGDQREKLITDLESEGVFPTLGPSMYFAFDGVHEFIRVNLFTDINRIGKILSKF